MLSEKIRPFLDEKAPQLVASYFADDGPFAGRTFDLLSPNESNEITSTDLVAVSMLDVSMSPPFVRWLKGEGGRTTCSLLREIPTDVPLWEATDDIVGDDSPADRLWRALKSQSGIGWVTAGKHMARKRPRLIPVYDSIIRAALGAPDSAWFQLRDTLKGDAPLRDELTTVRHKADLDPKISLLRVLDVAIWMRNSQSRNAKKARQQAGLHN